MKQTDKKNVDVSKFYSDLMLVILNSLFKSIKLLSESNTEIILRWLASFDCHKLVLLH